MRKRLLFVAGIAAGYVIGARAGRPAYDAVVERFNGFTSNPTVTKVGEKAKQTLEEKAPAVADVVGKATSTVAGAAAAASDAGAESSSEDESPKPAPPKSSNDTTSSDTQSSDTAPTDPAA